MHSGSVCFGLMEKQLEEQERGSAEASGSKHGGGSGGIAVVVIPQATPVPSWLWEQARTGKGGEVFLPTFPKKDKTPPA